MMAVKSFIFIFFTARIEKITIFVVFRVMRKIASNNFRTVRTVTHPNNLGSFRSALLLYWKAVLLFWSYPYMEVKYSALVPLDRLFD